MMMLRFRYYCNECDNTKDLYWDEKKIGRPFAVNQMPHRLPCNRRGCHGTMYPERLPEKVLNIRVPVLMLLCAFSWLVIATWIPLAIIPFWVCMAIAILQLIVANA